jgi:hypothetical protein
LAVRREWPTGQLAVGLTLADTGGVDPVPDFGRVIAELLPKIILIKFCKTITGRSRMGVFRKSTFLRLLNPKKLDETTKKFGIKWSKADRKNIERIYADLIYERGSISAKSRRHLCLE